ncbi:hypothetical protein D3C78_1657420 [compost metagenome]
MQRLIDTCSQQTIGLHRQEHIGCLDADFELVEVETVKDINVAHGGFEQRFRRRLAVFFLDVFFQRTTIHPDTDWDIFIARAVYD